MANAQRNLERLSACSGDVSCFHETSTSKTLLAAMGDDQSTKQGLRQADFYASRRRTLTCGRSRKVRWDPRPAPIERVGHSSAVLLLVARLQENGAAMCDLYSRVAIARDIGLHVSPLLRAQGRVFEHFAEVAQGRAHLSRMPAQHPRWAPSRERLRVD